MHRGRDRERNRDNYREKKTWRKGGEKKRDRE